MPYKSEKIKIAGTKHDRRKKLDDQDKELIRWLREEEKISYQKLADQFNVSKRLIMFVINPEMLEKCKKQRALRGGSKIYYKKEYHTEAIREHRAYKNDLYKKSEITLKNEENDK